MHFSSVCPCHKGLEEESAIPPILLFHLSLPKDWKREYVPSALVFPHLSVLDMKDWVNGIVYSLALGALPNLGGSYPASSLLLSVLVFWWCLVGSWESP